VAVEVDGGEGRSFDIDKIAAASPGIEFKGAPEGYVRSTRTITSGRRPGSDVPRPTVSMS